MTKSQTRIALDTEEAPCMYLGLNASLSEVIIRPALRTHPKLASTSHVLLFLSMTQPPDKLAIHWLPNTLASEPQLTSSIFLEDLSSSWPSPVALNLITESCYRIIWGAFEVPDTQAQPRSIKFDSLGVKLGISVSNVQPDWEPST